MANIRFNVGGENNTMNPADRAKASDQVPPASPNSPWFLRNLSQYNRPPSNFASPNRMDYAAELQSDAINRARKANEELNLRIALQETEKQRLAQESSIVPSGLQETGIFGDIASGVKGFFAPPKPLFTPEQSAERNKNRPSMDSVLAAATERMSAESGIGLPLPENFVKDANILKQRGIDVEPIYRGGKVFGYVPKGNPGPDRPGYEQSPILDSNEQILGYEYIKLAQAPTLEEFENASQPGSQVTPTGGLTGFVSIYDEIKALENSFSTRKTKVAEEVWGTPVKETVTNPDGSTYEKLVWGTNGMEYLGLNPGQIYAALPPAPAADAPYEDFKKYRNRLVETIKAPLYTPDSLDTIWNNLGIKGIKEFQRAALKARLYDTNDPVTFGAVSDKEYTLMQGLMERANMNGTTWEKQMELMVQHGEIVKARGGGGGGGGGGSGGTSVYTQVTFNNTSMAQARSTLTAVLKDALGRMPSEQELTDFIAMLNEAESKSPTRTVTRTTKTGDNTRAVARTTPSVVDPEQMAQEFAADIGGGAPMAAKKETDYLMGYLNSLGGLG